MTKSYKVTWPKSLQILFTRPLLKRGLGERNSRSSVRCSSNCVQSVLIVVLRQENSVELPCTWTFLMIEHRAHSSSGPDKSVQKHAVTGLSDWQNINRFHSVSVCCWHLLSAHAQCCCFVISKCLSEIGHQKISEDIYSINTEHLWCNLDLLYKIRL